MQTLPDYPDPAWSDPPAATDMAEPLARVCLCVDDFGLHAGINEAVIELVQLGRVGATGVMVDGPAWAEGARALREQDARMLDVGLHFNLTELPGPAVRLARQPLRNWWQAAWLGRIDAPALQAEIARQCDAFETHMQRPPAFVDGHQHVHQLPQIREALLAELARRQWQPAPWLRDTLPGTGWQLVGLGPAVKARVIAALGRKGLMQQAHAQGWRSNRRLLGVYGFEPDARRYQRLLSQWLLQAQDGDLLMCHPATQPVPGDAIAAARCIEHQVLASPWLGGLLQRLPLSLGPLSRYTVAQDDE